MKTALRLSLLLGWLIAQCPTTFPTPPDCNNCTPLGVSPGGHAVVPAGQTRCIPATMSVTLKTLDIKKDGSLIVCGTLTVEGDLNLNENNSAVWIAPTGVVNALGINLNSHTNLYNFGQLNGTHLNLNGSNAAFWTIGTGAQTNISGSINVNASCQFITHQGQVNAGSLTLNGSANACMSNGACISVTNFTSNGSAAVQVTGSDPVAISYTGHATLNGAATTSSLLHVCQGPTSTTGGSGGWGSAQVFSNCTSGCGVLPISRLLVQAQQRGDEVLLRWRYEGAMPAPAYYTVYVWDGSSFQLLYPTPTQELAIGVHALPPKREWLFQVVGWGEDGQKVAAGQVAHRTTELSFRVWPTNFTDRLQYTYGGQSPAEAHLLTASGQLVGRLDLQGETGTWYATREGVALETLPRGMYLLLLRDSQGSPIGETIRLIR